MAVEAVNQNLTVRKNLPKNQQPSFTGSFNPVVTLMDFVDKGGFAASFIAQDGIGMVAPRIYEGLNRNRPKDEDGKKTGPLNWEFARREGIRELLSGPSAFLIPLGLLSIIKKVSGTANNVYVSHINALGGHFAEYASKNPAEIKDAKAFKKGYYTQVFENVLSNSTDKNLTGDALKTKAAEFANDLLKAEELRTGGRKKVAKQEIGKLVEKFMKIRKATTPASSNEMAAVITSGDKTVNTSISRVIQSLSDYTGDALKHVNKHSSENLTEYIKKFNLHRSGTRVIANLGMWSAVVGFYTLIPKLYNIGIKHDPGLKGLEAPEETKDKKDVSFTGLTSELGKFAQKDGKLNKLLNVFEFNGASMSVNAMLTLLFGFTLPPRYINAKSDKEKKEILVRDITSFTAILFFAKALSRGFSNAFAKVSGLALNIKPQDHSKSFFNKFKNYFSAGSGIEVLSSDQLVSKYSNINEYKEGINGFFKFLEENGGDVKKVLNIDKTVQENAEKIMKNFNGKSLKDATMEEIHKAFKNAAGKTELENIYSVFSSANNKFVNRAKTFNSAFGFASTLVLVPAFMMWLARYCEKMTKKAVEKERAEKMANDVKASSARILGSKPTMAGFLNKTNS